MSRITFLYPGTGSQYTGMFKDLYEQYAVVRETFQEAAESLQVDLTQMCFENGFPEQASIAHAQVAILVCSVAGHRLYMQEVGLKPAMAAGHSLGEWSALTCAGALDLADAVKLVSVRGQWMEEAVPVGGGLIVAVSQLSPQVVEEFCIPDAESGGIVEVACYNAPDQVVIAGHRQAVEKASNALEARGAKVVRLKANVPFHTSLMQSAAEKFAAELAQQSFRKLEWPVFSNVTAAPHEDEVASIRRLLAGQLMTAVRWEETIRLMQRKGVHYAVELGPQKVLKQLNRKIARNIQTYAIDTPGDWPPMFQLQQLQPSFIDQCLSIAVSTRNQNHNAADYEIEVIAPYKKLQQIHHDSLQAGLDLAPVRKKESLELLEQILIGKQVSEVDLNSWLVDLNYQLHGEG